MKKTVVLLTLAVAILFCSSPLKAAESAFAAKMEQLKSALKARAIQTNDPKVVEAIELLTQKEVFQKLFATEDRKASRLFGFGKKAKAKKAVKQYIKEQGWGMTKVLWTTVIEKEDIYVVKTTLLMLIMPSLWEFHVDKKTFEIIKEVEVESFD